MTTQEDRLRRLIRDTVHETLASIGFDLQDQSKLQADMLYLRRIREGGEDIVRKVRNTTLGVVLSAGLYLVWEGFQRLMRGGQ